MAKKRKTDEVKLAELVRDMGIERAETYFQFLKALNTLKTDPKPRKKAIQVDEHGQEVKARNDKT